MPFPTRGSVYLVNLDPTIGAEMKKTRPAVVISNDIMNQYTPLVIVALITGRAEARFHEVGLQPPEGGLTKASVIVPTQIRTIDKLRLVKELGHCSTSTMARLDQALAITLSLVQIS